jgi:nicotinamidase-related amidase
LKRAGETAAQRASAQRGTAAPRAGDPHGNVAHRSRTALLILDLISDFEFEGGAQLCRRTLPVARRVASLKARAKRAGVPVLYLNDNLGLWRSDFPGMVQHCLRRGSRGSQVTSIVRPAPDDYCVLKPKHSGFYGTPLGKLLEYMGARTLILTGTASNQCVLFTANDAYLRDFRLIIPRDCICGLSKAATELALRYFRTVLSARISASTRLDLRRIQAGALR